MKIGKRYISFNDFTIANESNFPESECAVIGKEAGVYESPIWYECVVLDANHPQNGFQVMALRPYIYKDENVIGYGWTSGDHAYYDNCYNPIHNDDRCVIAFKPVAKYMFDLLEKSFSETIKENWIGE